jgi:hypothetical protein
MKNNKWRHGPARFEIIDLDLLIGPCDGLIPVPVMLDSEIGDEVALFLRDQTPFMQELKRVRPFQLFLKVGAGRNRFGPVPFLLFYVPNPADDSKPFVAYDLYLNPGSDNQVLHWRKSSKSNSLARVSCRRRKSTGRFLRIRKQLSP